eukprot:10517852-Prorocentrum_lima.AAC.1
MTSSLVGSEMCIRDSIAAVHHIDPVTGFHHRFRSDDSVVQRYQYCLLYTSDAADELDGVDL